MVMGQLVVYEAFPFEIKFWGFKVGVLVATSTVVLIMFEVEKKSRKKSRGQILS